MGVGEVVVTVVPLVEEILGDGVITFWDAWFISVSAAAIKQPVVVVELEYKGDSRFSQLDPPFGS